MVEEDTNDAQAHQQPEPSPDLRSLGDRLVGTWKTSGGTQGKVTYEWVEGGFFLLQRVDLEQHGQRIRGIEVIGHERPFGVEPSEEIKSRFYDNMGNTSNTSTRWRGTHSRSGAESGGPRRTTEVS